MEDENYILQIGIFYVAISFTENLFGLAFTAGYVADEKTFQVVLQIGSVALAVGFDVG